MSRLAIGLTLYSPVGKTAVMNGPTLTSTYIPLPGGETLYVAGTQQFWHKDWLGSVRLASTYNSRTITVNGDTGNVLTISIFTGNSGVIPFVTNQITFNPGKTCSAALRAAGANNQAIVRYYGTYKQTISSAANANGIGTNLLAAIGIHESGLQNIPQQNRGQGLEVFQIDLGAHPEVSANQALDPVFSANFAASLLNSNMNTLSATYPNFSQAQLLRATAASYNFGAGNISGNPDTIDVGTTGNNYGSSVVAIANNCF